MEYLINLLLAVVANVGGSLISKQQGVEKGLAKGRKEGHLESLSGSVTNLVRSGRFSVEAALDILKVPADIRSTVKENAEKALSK